jgi:hypothetical protein
MSRFLPSPKTVSGQPLCEVGREPPESLARGTLSKRILQELGKASQSPHALQRYAAVEGDQRPLPMGCEESYEPIVPMKMANRRAKDVVAATEPIGGKGRTEERIG